MRSSSIGGSVLPPVYFSELYVLGCVRNIYTWFPFPSVFQAEHRTMAVFILAVIVNSYTTGQVQTSPSSFFLCRLFCCSSLSSTLRGTMYQIIQLLSSAEPQQLLSGLRRHFERWLHRLSSVSGRYWLCDIFVIDTWRCNLRLLHSHLHGDTLSPQLSLCSARGLGSVQSPKPLVSDTDQTSKGFDARFSMELVILWTFTQTPNRLYTVI